MKNKISLLFILFLSACGVAPTIDLDPTGNNGPPICTGDEPIWIIEGVMHSYDPTCSEQVLSIGSDLAITIDPGHYVTLVPVDNGQYVQVQPGDEVTIMVDWQQETGAIQLLPYERLWPNKYRFTPGLHRLAADTWQYTFTASEPIQELALEVQPIDHSRPITLGIYASIARLCANDG